MADTKIATLSELIEAAGEIARSESRRPEEVLKDAIDLYQQGRRLEILAMRAEARNLAKQRPPSYVEKAIAEDRRDHPICSR